MKKEQKTITAKKRSAKTHVATAKDYDKLAETTYRAAQEHCIEASKYCVQAEDHATIAENQAIVACQAAKDAERYYLSAKACAEDAVELRRKAGFSMDEAAHEARSAMRCVVWCFCAAVLSLLFLIAHFIL